jgi:hypothetical protein
MYKPILAALACALAAACAATSETQTASSTANDVRCVKQAPTGSHIAKNDCRTAAQREQDRKEAEEYLQRQRGVTPPPQVPGGN